MFTLRLLKLKIHSRRVFVFKRVLPVFAFLLASIMIAWPALNEQKDKFALAPSSNDLKNNNSDMEAVRYFAKDSEQNPMTITAQTVRELDSTRKIIGLTKPNVRYVMSDGVVLSGETSYGLIFQNDKYLYFEEQVDAKTDTGYDAVSEKIVCDYNAGTLGSEQDVFIKGPAGMLKANGFYMKNKGNYLYFKGYTATLLFQREKQIHEVELLDFEQQKSYLKDDAQNIYITSENGLIINQEERTVTAQKNIDVYQGKNHLESQNLILYYVRNHTGKTEIQKMIARGNVIVTTPAQRAIGKEMTVYRARDEIGRVLEKLPQSSEFKTAELPAQITVLSGQAMLKEGINVVKADKIYALYDKTGSEMIKAIALGNMSATNGQQRIYGQKGVYTPATKNVSVYEKVSLHEKESVLKGEYATLNLKTGISSLSAPETGTSTGRVKGQIIPSNFESDKRSEDK